MAKRVIVIGAGPAGLAAAYELSCQGAEVDVFEASNQVGGMARSLRLWGEWVDCGPHHFLSDFAYVNDLWQKLLKNDYHVIERVTRIYYKGHYFHYPLQAADVIQQLSPLELVDALASYTRQMVLPTALDGSFETWVTRQFGARLYETFFRPYSEKLWGISCSALDDEFARQRIRRFSLGEAIKAMLDRRSTTSHRTLATRFIYPNEGAGVVYRRMVEVIEANGGRIHYQSPVARVRLNDQGEACGISTVSGNEFEADSVISSMPLTQLIHALPEVPETVQASARQLTYRNTILVFLRLPYRNVCPDHWLYIHSPELKMGRITNFDTWRHPQAPVTQNQSIVSIEYWSQSHESLWQMSDEELVRLAQHEMRQTGLIPPDHVFLPDDGTVVRLPKCYPIYHKGYVQALKPVEAYLSSIPQLWPIGRYGAFKYNNQDHSMLMGKLAADHALGHPSIDLWTLNHHDQVVSGIELAPAENHPLYAQTPAWQHISDTSATNPLGDKVSPRA